jgi:hypothetical protein
MSHDRAVPRQAAGSITVRVVALTVAAALVISLGAPAGAGEDTSATRVDERRFGVATPSNGWDPGELDAVEHLVGASPSVVLHYLGFVDELHAAQLDAVADAGAVSLLTWEPFDWTGTVPDQDFALRRIIAGDFDAYLERTARTLQAFGGPVLLRFAHEMNGLWYPWSEANNGNRPGDYVAAWQHVHGVFARLGVDNVTWVWSPNVEYPGSLPLAGLYPGDGYVDAIALDGYNWGATAGHATGWRSPAEVFDPTLDVVRALAPGVPVMIGETGSTDEGGDKVAWIDALFPWLADRGIDTLVWFHLDKEADWRIDSSPGTSEAFAAGLRAWRADAGGGAPTDPPGDDAPGEATPGDDAGEVSDGPLTILTPASGDRVVGDLQVTGRVAPDLHRVEVRIAGVTQKTRPAADGRWQVVFARGTLRSGTHVVTTEARGRRNLREVDERSVTIVGEVSQPSARTWPGGPRR